MKNGFTLIELLAVIVILAIIALIAVPIVLNIINESKESSLLRSAEFYLDAVEYTIADAYLYHGGLNNGDYPITPEGDICKVALVDNKCPMDGDKSNALGVEVNGDKPIGGTITINSGNISDVIIKFDEKTIIKNSDGELVYQDSNELKLCTANVDPVTAFVWKGNCDPSLSDSYNSLPVGSIASESGAYTPGVSYTCNFIDEKVANNMTFFVLSSTENEVTLITGENISENVPWCLSGTTDNSCNADGAKATLEQYTLTWKKLNNSQKATIEIPTAYQIASAAEITFNGSIMMDVLPTWLYSSITAPETQNYWTSTPCETMASGSPWFIASGGIVNNYIGDVSSRGLRAVITLSKSDI